MTRKTFRSYFCCVWRNWEIGIVASSWAYGSRRRWTGCSNQLRRSPPVHSRLQPAPLVGRPCLVKTRTGSSSSKMKDAQGSYNVKYRLPLRLLTLKTGNSSVLSCEATLIGLLSLVFSLVVARGLLRWFSTPWPTARVAGLKRSQENRDWSTFLTNISVKHTYQMKATSPDSFELLLDWLGSQIWRQEGRFSRYWIKLTGVMRHWHLLRRKR